MGKLLNDEQSKGDKTQQFCFEHSTSSPYDTLQSYLYSVSHPALTIIKGLWERENWSVLITAISPAPRKVPMLNKCLFNEWTRDWTNGQFQSRDRKVNLSSPLMTRAELYTHLSNNVKQCGKAGPSPLPMKWEGEKFVFPFSFEIITDSQEVAINNFWFCL